MLRNFVKAATENLQRQYDVTTSISHMPEKGTLRESFVVNLIRPILPLHFDIGSGIVIDAYDRQSKQCDVIIYDNRLIPPILRAGDSGIYPIDSVLVVIEVKSCLKAVHYVSLVEAARRLSPQCAENPDGLRIVTRANTEDGKTPYPLYAVFAYTSDAKHKDEFQRLEEKVAGGKEFIRLIGVLNKGRWSYTDGCYSPPDPDKGEISIKFLISLLTRIEKVAEQRGKFMLQNWLE